MFGGGKLFHQGRRGAGLRREIRRGRIVAITDYDYYYYLHYYYYSSGGGKLFHQGRRGAGL